MMVHQAQINKVTNINDCIYQKSLRHEEHLKTSVPLSEAFDCR